jgi:hypothetical protein
MALMRTREEAFQDAINRSQGEETVDELIALTDEVDMWDDDPGLRKAERNYKANVIRKLARQGGWTDADGNPTELFNVKRQDPSTGEVAQLYIQPKFATLQDFTHLVRDRQRKGEYFYSEARRIYDLGCQQLCGADRRKFQQLFQFD